MITLLSTTDVYQNITQLRDMDDDWDKAHYLDFTDLFMPKLIAGTCLILGAIISKKHYKAAKGALGSVISLSAYVDQWCSDLDHKAVKTAIKTLADNDYDGAIRFRTSTYVNGDGDITTKTLLSWKSTY